MTSTMKIILSIVITALVIGFGTYYIVNSTATAEKDALQAQIDAKTPTKTTTASPTATTSTSAYSTFKADSGYTFDYPKTWSFYKTGDGEGLTRYTYTAIKAHATQTGAYDAANATVENYVYPKGTTGGTLTEYLANVQSKNNVTDVKVGAAKYAAKRYDDGGGFSGTTVTYLTSVPKATGETLIITVSYESSKPTETPSDIQKILDTLAVQ